MTKVFQVGKTYKRIEPHPMLNGAPDPIQYTNDDGSFLCEYIGSTTGNPQTSEATFKGESSLNSYSGYWAVGDANELELGRFVEVEDD